MCHLILGRIKWQYYLAFVYGFLVIIATQTASTGMWYTFFGIFWLLLESLLLFLPPLSFLWTNLFPQGPLLAATFMKTQTLAWEKVFVSLRVSSQFIICEVAFSNLDWFTIVLLWSQRSNSEASPSSAFFWHQLFEWIVEISSPTFTLFQSFLIRFFFYLSYCSTAVATLRQAVALIFDRVLRAEGLPILHYGGIGGRPASSTSVAGEVSRSMSASEYVVQSELLS